MTMPRTTKKKTAPEKTSLSVRQFLDQAPLEQEVRQYGDGLHIPILNLENLLDYFRWGTRNFVWHLYKDGYAKLSVGASLELLLSYTDENGEKVVDRPFVGACNFSLSSLEANEDWLATAKSLCIKNAASDAGRKLGRGLNADVVPARKEANQEQPRMASVVKMKPDEKILARLQKAREENDATAITILEKVYDLKPQNNGNQTV